MAAANPFRFSTKYQDDETGLLYYGYRYYNASTGRWLSRDPIGEQGGVNQSSFVGNQPISRVDKHGLYPSSSPSPPWHEHQTCIECRCLSVEVRYEPSEGGAMSLEWYIDPTSRRPKFGASVYVTWKVEGDPEGCHYWQDERNASSETIFPDGHVYSVKTSNNPSEADYIDDMGVYAQGDGPYFVNVKWDVTFRCISSDRTVPPVEHHDGLWWFMVVTSYPPPFPPVTHE